MEKKKKTLLLNRKQWKREEKGEDAVEYQEGKQVNCAEDLSGEREDC